MAKFHRKPDVVDAFQLSDADWPDWWHAAIKSNVVSVTTVIKSPEGTNRAERDDWIVRSADGGVRALKPAAFNAEYDPAVVAPRAAPVDKTTPVDKTV